ncbi:sigma-70 family RNA polymerase sigma factor [Nocardia sp. SYP-A9097]|uniref:RNA polymerase sigma factor n=1 Tax=Nocardia sp. SYP-A9097 TaxID=2663237 RepID=UPI00129A7ECA|nr:RNA polymerase sigma factor [Nocardia sp. SYP-A9097]MRH89398.1 sigma-70 family RNA polymerase sigma factor [Nocardia sp. SYP-A9097]
MGSATVDIATIETVFTEHYGRAVASLIRAFGDVDIAEDAVQDAFTTAIRRWPVEGLPPSPPGWIITTARNRAVDRLRRDAAGRDKYAQAALLHERDEPVEADAVYDDRLRLIFTCCHPALARPTQVALTLRLLGGLSTTELAHTFLVPESTMAQRITRAKNKIRDARIPYRVPSAAELPARLNSALAVLYLIFTEGHTAASGENLVRADLCTEGIRLARVLAEILPDEPEVWGLLALMLLTESRRTTRTTSDGSLIPLPKQDRTLWNRTLIEEGQALVRKCLHRNQPGPYQLQAAINAVHADATNPAETDWQQILHLYDQLETLSPSPIISLNRAVALAEVHGPQSALDAVDALNLQQYYLFHAIRADLLRRLGKSAEAAQAYDAAITRTHNQAERNFLLAQRDAVASPT